MTVVVETIGPAVSLQDVGRAGGLGVGLSRGGAADREGYLAALALLDAPIGAVAFEMAGFGGTFRFNVRMRFSLAGAAMRVTLDGDPIAWNASHSADAGSVLTIGAAEAGVYGYFLPGGGVVAEEELGGRGFHEIAALGQRVSGGETYEVVSDANPTGVPCLLNLPTVRTTPIRVMPGPQTDQFPPEQLELFAASVFRRSPRANRQGVRLEHEGAPFSAGGQLSRVSDFISEGDVQMTGDGVPYVLLADCQTMGGYPRIGTVLPEDLPRVAQAELGAALQFQFVTVGEAEAMWKSDEDRLSTLKRMVKPRIRDPREMADLLSYEFIDKPIQSED